MSTLKVSVKWQKELFKDVEIDTTQTPYLFKAQLFDLTGVPPERQKVMVKGGLLKDDADWSEVGVKNGQKLMMMGTADEVVRAPEKGPLFSEDMPEEALAVNVGHCAGLQNLGNTCYMNSTVQCLHSVPELKSALVQYPLVSGDLDQSNHRLTTATRDLFINLDKSVQPVSPMRFWTMLKAKFPQFGEMNRGAFMQQDAEECWSQLLFTLSQSLKSSDRRDLVKELFGVEFVSRVSCAESGEESTERESVYSLKCHISHEVNHLHEGLKRALVSDLEKTCPSLGRSAVYVKDSRIDELPKYLTIQFVRFFWKRESNQKAKILRKVDYPLELDVFDLCSDDLKKKLETPRRMLREEEARKAGVKTANKRKLEESSSSPDNDDVVMEEVVGTETGKEDRLTGVYDLVAVLTHKGRSADSGHYVAWVKQESGKWVLFDDANPSVRREEDIIQLSGGADWHMAYICMYKARMIPM